MRLMPRAHYAAIWVWVILAPGTRFLFAWAVLVGALLADSFFCGALCVVGAMFAFCCPFVGVVYHAHWLTLLTKRYLYRPPWNIVVLRPAPMGAVRVFRWGAGVVLLYGRQHQGGAAVSAGVVYGLQLW